MRCWCCCGGCPCCGAAAGWVASAARAGPPVAVQSLCQPRSQAGTQVSALSARGQSQTMGAAGGLLPLHSRPPGLHPRDAPGFPTLPLPWGRGLGVAGRWNLGRCPRVYDADPPRGTGAGCAPLWISREGTCGRAAPRELAESVGPSNSLSPSRAAASYPGVPGSQGPRVGSQLRRGHSETSPSAISDADRAQSSPHAGAALLCLTSAKPFRTNSCCPNSDEPPV